MSENGTLHAINPNYVTSVVDGEAVTLIWVVGHAGYGTYSIRAKKKDYKNIVDLLNHEQ